MSKQTRVYSPLEFLDRLVHDDLRRPLKLTGMIQKAENNDNQVLFAVGTQCANWRKVPLGIIENIEELDVVSCEDHVHPLVKISFKEPESEEALLFASFVTDVVNDAKHVVVEFLEQLEASGAISRDQIGCAECWRSCHIEGGEDFFRCFQQCAPVCPG